MTNCFLWFHDWLRWEETDRGMAEYTDAFGRIGNANIIVMERKCFRCGLKQVKRQRAE